jgi:hypothetical protein
MRFGKREQIVGLGISTIIAIALLHLLVFGPKAEEFVEVQEELEKAKRDGANVALLDRPADLVNLRKSTEAVRAGYDDLLTSLGLTRPIAFYDPVPASVKIDPSETEGMNARERETFEKEERERRLQSLRRQRREQQVQMVFAEIRKLQETTRDSTSAQRRNRTRLPFLARDWRVPLELPEGAQGARLRDNLREALGTLEIIAMIGAGQPGLRDQQQSQFDQKIRDIGIDNDLYRDTGPDSLAAQGQLIPFLHKLTLAMMLEEQLDATRDVGGVEIDRRRLYELIEFHLPQESLLSSDQQDPIGVGELYFVYETLRFVNEFFALAAEFEVVEISSLRPRDPSYLTDMGPPPLPWNEGGVYPPRDPPVVRSPYTFGKEKPVQLVLPPAKESLGYCIPFDLQFRATNRLGWTFLYEILRRYRLAEIDELSITSIRDAEGGELNWRVRLLHVPLLFATDVEPGLSRKDT